MLHGCCTPVALDISVVRLYSRFGYPLRQAGSDEETGIFEADAEMAEDPELHSEVEERARNLESPEAAVLALGEEFAGIFAAMDDKYMAARADDFRDVASHRSLPS